MCGGGGGGIEQNSRYPLPWESEVPQGYKVTLQEERRPDDSFASAICLQGGHHRCNEVVYSIASSHMSRMYVEWTECTAPLSIHNLILLHS